MDLCIEREGTRATQKYQSAQKYNSVFSIRISMYTFLAFRHFRKFVLIYLYELEVC